MTGALVFRLLAWSFALLLLALPVVGVLNGSFASDRWPLRRLELQAELKQVSAEQIQRVVSQYSQRGFFALSLTDLRQALAALPWVETVEVRKRWPDTVAVRVLEYQPYAIWADRALVSRSGHLFEVPGVEALGGLPRLSGPDAQVADVVNFHARAATLLHDARLSVAKTQLSSRGSWSLSLDGGARVVLGREQHHERLARFAATIAPLLHANPGKPLRHADLRYPNGYALTWAEPDARREGAPVPAEPASAAANVVEQAHATPIVPAQRVDSNPVITRAQHLAVGKDTNV